MTDPKDDDDKLEAELKEALEKKKGADESGITAAGKNIKLPSKNGKKQ